MWKKSALWVGWMMFAGQAVGAAEVAKVPEEYSIWLRELKKEMVERGISQKTVDVVFAPNYYHPKPEAVEIDRKQAEFVLTSNEYINRVLSAEKVLEGQRRYRELYPLFRDMEKKYGVPFEYIVAFWGMETYYGKIFGNFQVIETLTVLSYDTRRPKFFKNELYQALKIVDEQGIDFTKMEGSWAGAMGHFQFMPSTFNAYGVDYNGDGKIDIWHSFEDAAGSAANYLSDIGWKKNLPWGAEVKLPWSFDYALSGRNVRKKLKEWKRIGVVIPADKAKVIGDETEVSIIVPEGKKGHAYLITDNFRKIMVWNRSENYALAVGILADYIKSGKKWKQVSQHEAVKVKTDDVLKVQSFLNKVGWEKLDEDGKLGAKTREAIKKVQKKARMPQDGYPDYRFLQKINNYNPKVGFSIPVQPKKSEKQDVQKKKQSLRTEKNKLN